MPKTKELEKTLHVLNTFNIPIYAIAPSCRIGRKINLTSLGKME